MNQADLKTYVLSNPKLVSMKPCGGYPGLFLLKYSKKVFFTGRWNRFLEECRGTIVNENFDVVSRPFTKIYNFRVEHDAPVIPDDTRVIALRKVNGFLGAITWYKDDLLISTTGTTDSAFVGYIKELIQPNIAHYRSVCSRYPDCTFMFEVVHRDDPHIVPAEEGLYLLGQRENSWDSRVNVDPVGLSLLAKEFNCFSVEHVILRVDELVSLTKTTRHEGYVLYTAQGVSAKIKSPYYLGLKAMARRADILTLDKRRVEEEYFALVDHLVSIKESFNGKTEQARLEYIRQYLTGESV